jgi:hypothetical protein
VKKDREKITRFLFRFLVLLMVCRMCVYSFSFAQKMTNNMKGVVEMCIQRSRGTMVMLFAFARNAVLRLLEQWRVAAAAAVCASGAKRVDAEVGVYGSYMVVSCWVYRW